MKTGLLRQGDQLPSAREVVLELGINPNTVLKAYRELEHEGLVEIRKGYGTFVALELMTITPAELAKLRRELGKWIASAQGLGMGGEDMLELFTAEAGTARFGEATA